MNDLASGSASTEIDASAEAVWSLVTDVTRMGEWSPETYRGEWIDDGPAVGNEFRGYNRYGTNEWFTECVVETCVPGSQFGFRVMRESIGGEPLIDMPKAGKTVWTYLIEPLERGRVRLTESFDAPWLLDPDSPPSRMPDRLGMMIAGCEATLANIKSAAEDR